MLHGTQHVLSALYAQVFVIQSPSTRIHRTRGTQMGVMPHSRAILLCLTGLCPSRADSCYCPWVNAKGMFAYAPFPCLRGKLAGEVCERGCREKLGPIGQEPNSSASTPCPRSLGPHSLLWRTLESQSSTMSLRLAETQRRESGKQRTMQRYRAKTHRLDKIGLR